VPVAVEPHDIPPPPGQSEDAHGILVVANETVGGRALLDEIAQRARGRKARVLVVAPALVESRLKHALGDVDEAVEKARERLERSVERIRSTGVDAEGVVGDADPNLAILDALRTFDADEVIISTHPRDRSTWLEKDVVERASAEIPQPITHVVVDLEAESEAQKATPVARLPRRVRRRRAAEGEESDYLPPMPLRDRITLVVAIAGTVVLGVLAVTCPDGGSFSGGCAVRGAIALGAFMITLWHSVALILMGSVRYRGFWSTAAADMVLWGVPPAIVVSLIVG
jgi:hypothetical protein